ncbi:MAG: RNA polymerase sigma factor [Defluviitaleaceae bacterium]|nr:RNA polymerase sigma factor [Defluviitaleaceae bacterium]
MIKINDQQILNLFLDRDENALGITVQKYGRILFKVAHNILNNNQDAEECVNDTLMQAWKVIPPKQPEFLGAYLAKIVRNFSLQRWRSGGAAKRGGGQGNLILDELQETIPHPNSAEQGFEYAQTLRSINVYLDKMDADSRIVFVRRYFFGDSVQDICTRFNASPSKIKSMLFRARQRLKTHLEKEGIVI